MFNTEVQDLTKLKFDGYIPYFLSFITILAVLQVLDYLRPNYLIQRNRFWEETSFSTGLPLFGIQVFVLLVAVLWILMNRPKAIFFPALVLFTVFFLDSSLSLAIAALICVGVCLYINPDLEKYTLGIIVLLGLIEAVALVNWLIFAPLGLADHLVSVTLLEYDLYYFFAQLAPYFMILFVLSGFSIPLYWLYKNRIIDRDDRISPPMLRGETLLLGLCLLLGVFVAVYTYLPTINPLGLNPGVDIVDLFLESKIVEGDVSQAFQASGGSRPLYYLMLLGIHRITGLDSLNAVRFAPVLLNPLLIFSAFFFAREVYVDNRTALFAAFFTASGSTLAVGMYAYISADLLMLSLIFISLSFLFNSLRTGSLMSFSIATVVGCLCVFTHPWTLDQYIAGIGATAILVTYLYYVRQSNAVDPKWLLIYCAIILVVNFLKIISLGGGVDAFAALGTVGSGLTTPGMFWLDIVNSSRFYMGGFLTNMPLLALAALGLLKGKEKNVPYLFFMFFTVLSMSVYVVGDVVIKSRILFNIPLGVLAAGGVIYIGELKIGKKLERGLIITILVTILAYLGRNLSNLT